MAGFSGRDGDSGRIRPNRRQGNGCRSAAKKKRRAFGSSSPCSRHWPLRPMTGRRLGWEAAPQVSPCYGRTRVSAEAELAAQGGKVLGQRVDRCGQHLAVGIGQLVVGLRSRQPSCTSRGSRRRWRSWRRPCSTKALSSLAISGRNRSKILREPSKFAWKSHRSVWL